MMITVEELLGMSQRERWGVMKRAHPIPRDELAETQYLGVDLSLPPIANRVLWKTFRKTFHRDPVSGEIRGWNVKMEQNGWSGAEQRPLLDRRGRPICFGHYRLRSARGTRFPFGWRGEDMLDYHTAGNAYLDPGRLGFCPLVAVNEGSADLLLGWEIFKVGPAWVPLPDFWALVREGPLDEVVLPPRHDR